MWFPLSINYKSYIRNSGIRVLLQKNCAKISGPGSNRLYSRKPSSPATFRSLKRKEQRNLDEKTVICEIVEAMEYDTFTTFQDWENKTQEIIALQAKWKTIGYAPQKWTWRYSNVSVPLVMNFQTQSRVLQVHQGKYGRQSGKEESIMWKSRSTKRKHRLESNCWYSKQITKGMENNWSCT